MYKAAARWLIRHNIAVLNDGRYTPTLRMFRRDATLTFPGDNSWSRMYREPGTGQDAVPTHRGTSEIEAFLVRYVEQGMQMVVDDILVNGPPWRTRAAIRVHHSFDDPPGVEVYANRAVLWVDLVWGRIRAQEDYEDTQRVAADDQRRLGSS